MTTLHSENSWLCFASERTGKSRYNIIYTVKCCNVLKPAFPTNALRSGKMCQLGITIIAQNINKHYVEEDPAKVKVYQWMLFFKAIEHLS